MKKTISAVFLFFMMLILSKGFVSAAEFRTSKDENLTISETEQVENLYAGGNLVSIDADVDKSLFVGGSVVTINGDVEDSLFAGGGTVIVKGDVGKSIHVGGGTVIIEGEVGDDLFVGGGTVTLTSTASVKGDLVAGGGVVNVRGPIEGDVLLGAGQAVIDSKIGGQVKARVDEFSIGENAAIAGDLLYDSSKELKMATGSTVGGEVKFNQVNFDEIPSMPVEEIRQQALRLQSWGFVVRTVVSLATALVIFFFFRKGITKVTEGSLKNFWSRLGVGFGVLVLIPLLGIVLMVTMIGARLAVLTVMGYIMAMIIAAALGSIAFGSWLMKLFKNQKKYQVDWQTIILGVLAMNLLRMIPLIGGLTNFIFLLVSLGSLYLMLYQNIKVKK